MVDYKVIVYWETKLFVLCIFTGGIKGNKSKPLNGFRMLSLLSLWLDYFVCHLIMGLEFHFPQIAWIFFLKNLEDETLRLVYFHRGYQREQVKTLKRFSNALFVVPVIRLFRLPPHHGVGISLSSDCMNLFFKELSFSCIGSFLYPIKENQFLYHLQSPPRN